jgi:hypothetical protein
VVWSYWDLDLDADPYVIAGWGLTNNMGSTQTFTLTFTTSVIPITISTVHGGSTGGSISSNEVSGSPVATASTDGTNPFYAGLIDTSTVLTLYDDPSSWSTTSTDLTVNIDKASDGLPGPTLPSGTVASSISIVHKFTLTAGDSISGTSNFFVTPEPATIAMLGLGGLFVLRRRKSE